MRRVAVSIARRIACLAALLLGPPLHADTIFLEAETFKPRSNG